MFRYLLLPFLALRLSLAMIPWGIQLIWALLLPYRSLVIMLVLFTLVIVTAWYRLLSPESARVFFQKNGLSLTLNLSQEKTYFLSEQDFAVEQHFYESLLQQQPYNRDILINLSILAAQQGKETEAQNYLSAAKALDPNANIWH